MKKIKIIVGTYGHMKNGVPPVELIDKGSDPIEVSDAEAARLIKLGIAKEASGTDTTAFVAEETTEAEETAKGHLDAESLEEYTLAELKDLAGKLGLTFRAKATKSELIKLIAATEVDYPVADDTEDEEADEPPVLNAAEPE